MRVLHLPYNVASQIDTMVRALRDVGVETRGLVLDSAPIVSSESVETYSLISRRRHPVRGMIRTACWWSTVMKALRWADVVHWRWGGRGGAALPWDADLRYLALVDKPRLIDFCGSDIRIPEIASLDNAYIAKAYEQGDIRPRTRERSVANQACFARHGFRCILRRRELIPYLQKEWFPAPFLVESPVVLSEFEPKYPDPAEPRPLVVHCPSNKGTKGTSAVLRAIERLRGDHEFDFQLIHDVERRKALTAMRECDVMIDQLVIGEYGNAALEAMALGKPTVCFIKASLLAQYPPSFPIVNANQDNLVEVLGQLLHDGKRRHQIGRRSREYIEKHHDARKVAKHLVDIYEQLLEETRATRRRASRG